MLALIFRWKICRKILSLKCIFSLTSANRILSRYQIGPCITYILCKVDIRVVHMACIYIVAAALLLIWFFICFFFKTNNFLALKIYLYGCGIVLACKCLVMVWTVKKTTTIDQFQQRNRKTTYKTEELQELWKRTVGVVVATAVAAFVLEEMILQYSTSEAIKSGSKWFQTMTTSLATKNNDFLQREPRAHTQISRLNTVRLWELCEWSNCKCELYVMVMESQRR